jgi:hypothetical protein
MESMLNETTDHTVGDLVTALGNVGIRSGSSASGVSGTNGGFANNIADNTNGGVDDTQKDNNQAPSQQPVNLTTDNVDAHNKKNAKENKNEDKKKVDEDENLDTIVDDIAGSDVDKSGVDGDKKLEIAAKDANPAPLNSPTPLKSAGLRSQSHDSVSLMQDDKKKVRNRLSTASVVVYEDMRSESQKVSDKNFSDKNFSDKNFSNENKVSNGSGDNKVSGAVPLTKNKDTDAVAKDTATPEMKPSTAPDGPGVTPVTAVPTSGNLHSLLSETFRNWFKMSTIIHTSRCIYALGRSFVVEFRIISLIMFFEVLVFPALQATRVTRVTLLEEAPAAFLMGFKAVEEHLDKERGNPRMSGRKRSQSTWKK